MQSRYRDLIKNIGLITIGKALAKVVSILILPFYTTYLSPEDYGRIDMVTAYCALFMQPVTLCIDSAIFIFPTRKPDRKKKVYYSSGFFVSFIPIVIFCLAMYLLNGLSEDYAAESFIGTLTQNSFLLCLLVFSSFLSDFLQQMLRSLNRIGEYAAIGVLQSLIMIVFALFLLPRWGTKGYLYSVFFAAVSVVIVMVFYGRLWRWLSVKAVKSRYYFQMLRFSIPLIPAPALVWVQFQSNRPILAASWGMAAVGIFGFAARFPFMLSYFADSLCKAWEISALNEHVKQGFSSFYNNICNTFFFAGAAGCVFFPVIVEPIFRILIKEEFYPAIQYIPVCTLGVFLGICGQLLGANLTVRKQSYKFFWSSAVAAVVVAVGNWLLIPRYGVWGACVPTVLAAFAAMVVRYFIASSMFRLASAKRICIGLMILVAWVFAYATLAKGWLAGFGVSCAAFASLVFLFAFYLKGKLLCRLKRV